MVVVSSGALEMRGPQTIPEILRTSAGRYGAKVAVQMRQPDGTWRRLTFRQLAEAAADFAAGLLALGFAPGDHAAVILENSPEWAIGFLGVAMAGGVAVPIYYELRTEEIAYILRESDSRVAIVSRRVLDRLPPRGAVPRLERILVVNGDAESGSAGKQSSGSRPGDESNGQTIKPSNHQTFDSAVPFSRVAASATAEARAALERVQARPERLLTILYTSGTTGNPKGVMLRHANLAANVEQARRRIAVDERDHILLVLPLHHVFPMMAGLILPIAIGATVTYENDLRRVAERMGEVHPTVFLGVPALYALMMRRIVERADAEGRGEKLRKALHLVESIKQRTGINVGPLLFKGTIHRRLGGRLRFMVSGGAALPPEVARQYFNFGLLLIQGYGLSETSPVIAAQEVSRSKFLFTPFYERQLGTVGRALDGIEVRLDDVPDKQIFVDQQGEGELVVRGPNVMAGYYENERATREAFRDDVTEGPDRWFRTGDIGRIDPQGYVYITGRAKDVIVLTSGEKVHPDEVEEKLLESPLVEEIAVVGVGSSSQKGQGPGARGQGPREDERPGDPATRRPGEDGTQIPVSPHLRAPASPEAPGPAEAMGRVQAWAVIFPRYDALRERAQQEGQPLTEERARAWVLSDVRRLEQDIAPFKRMSEVVLADAPLPKTPLRKVKRFAVAQLLAADELSFSVARLRASAAALAAAATPTPEPAAAGN